MLKHPHLQEWMAELVGWCSAQELEVLRADAAQTAIKDLQKLVIVLSEIRRGAVRGMAEYGYSQAEIAKELGLSRARIDQILEAR
jgi:hypothetical protein